jgi:chemotaxis family two-component system response regulator Rcp1
MSPAATHPMEILVVEDSPGAVRLTIEALKEAELANHLSVVEDGDHALDFLYRRAPYSNVPRPDLILLDLNLPRKNGRDVLDVIKRDPALSSIPVIVLSSSQAASDVNRCYKLHANCYLVKPVEFSDFVGVIRGLEHFWLHVATLPVQ